MKIKADHNEFEDVDDIAFDLIMTIGTWQPDKLKRALEFLSCYINDFYYDYELTDEEFTALEESLNALKVYGHRGLGGF